MVLLCTTSDNSGGITCKKEYWVVAVSFNLHSKQISYNIIDDFGRLAFYEAYCFDIKDAKVEGDWVLRAVSNDYFSLLPEILSYSTFYEDFHNQESTALMRFKNRFPDLAEKLF